MLLCKMISATAGEMFYEPTGRVHSTAESTQLAMPAKILALMVAPSGHPVAEGK